MRTICAAVITLLLLCLALSAPLVAETPPSMLMFQTSTPHSVTVSFTAGSYTCSGTKGVSIYRASGTLASPGTFSKLTAAAVSPFVDLNVSAGQKFVYYATGTCDTMAPSESVPSNQVAVVIPLDQGPPPAPTITVTVASLDTTKSRSFFNASLTATPSSTITYTLRDDKNILLAAGAKMAANGLYDFTWVGQRTKFVTFRACAGADCVTQKVQ